MKDARLYLIHIGECIADINSYTAGGKAAFTASKMAQDAVVRRLQVMAESTMRLPDELKAAHSEIDWQQIRGFRNVLVHDYLKVDVEVVWSIVQRDLPPLKIAVEAMLAELDK